MFYRFYGTLPRLASFPSLQTAHAALFFLRCCCRLCAEKKENIPFDFSNYPLRAPFPPFSHRGDAFFYSHQHQFCLLTFCCLLMMRMKNTRKKMRIPSTMM